LNKGKSWMDLTTTGQSSHRAVVPVEEEEEEEEEEGEEGEEEGEEEEEEAEAEESSYNVCRWSTVLSADRL
jgi:hypothetical protein